MAYSKNLSDERSAVDFLPGAVIPAKFSYGPLLDVIKDQIHPILKDLEVYEGRSHFDPPQRAEPERFAKALRVLWGRH